MVVMETYSCDRPQARQILEQIAEDQEFEASLKPKPDAQSKADVVDDNDDTNDATTGELSTVEGLDFNREPDASVNDV